MISGLFLLLLRVYNVKAMKKRVLVISVISAVFALGLSLISINSNNHFEKVEAVQHIDNYGEYTYTGSYYDGISSTSSEGLNGTLRTSLTTLIHPTRWYGYSSTGQDRLDTQLQYADEDPTNSDNMVFLYSRDSVEKCHSVSANGPWNREHVWPQSLSNDCWGTSQAGTDLLHIRPTYEKTNNKRSNDKYGDLGKSGAQTITVDGVTMLYGYSNGTYFEPIDSVKGDVARIIMYVWTAYKNHYSNLPNITNVFQSYDVMLKWHTLDKPDELEGKRNDYAEASIQGNRNPFVDHPEYAWKIFGENCSNDVAAECQDTYPGDGTSKKMTGITLTGEATKKEYYAGESFNPQGLTITGNYDDGSTRDIPLTDCTWTPNPLLEGNTFVTCTYGRFTARYSGITVTKRPSGDEIPGDKYEVVFKKNSGDGSSPVSTKTILTDQVESNTLLESATGCDKAYPGKYGIKIGATSGSGSLSFNLKADAKTQIKKVEVITHVYGQDSATYTLKLGDRTIVANSPMGVDYAIEFDNYINASALSFITDTQRGYLTSIKFIVEEKQDVPPDSGDTSSSEPPSTSSVDSSEPAEPSIISDSSSEPISSNDEGSSSPNEEKNAFGCNGSIVGVASLTSLSALIGLVFIFSKKKK